MGAVSTRPKRAAAATGDPPSIAAGRLLALTTAAYVCARSSADPDLWGHVRFGLDILRNREVSTVDPYSFTQDAPQINHEWLGDVFQALSYQAAGTLGLVLLKAAILTAAFVVVRSVVRRAGEPAGWWLMAAAVIPLGPIAFAVRPQVWTILGIAIVCHILAPPAPRDRRLWLLPPLFALWANLHGAWILGMAVAGLWLVGRVIDTRSLKEIVRPAAAIALAFLATAINPHGWRVWLFFLSTASSARNIQEWRPVWEQHDPSFAVLWGITAVVVVATAIRRWRRLSWAAMLPIAWFAVNGLIITRVAPLFGVVAAMSLASAWETPGAVRHSIQRRSPLFVVDAMAVALVALLNLIPESRCLTMEGTWTPDLAAASAFEPPEIRGRVVLPIDWGGYAIWHWGPRLRVSIDSRIGPTRGSETVYSDETIQTQIAIWTGQPEGLRYLDRVRPEYVWLKLPAGKTTQMWLRTNGYRIDVETPASFIARRDDLPPLTPAPSMSACFP